MPAYAFSTEELRRDFAQPSHTSIQRLKRLVRYLVHHAHLVWKFAFLEPKDMISSKPRAVVGTEFAGRQKTRWSTSDGCVVWANMCFFFYFLELGAIYLST